MFFSTHTGECRLGVQSRTASLTKRIETYALSLMRAPRARVHAYASPDARTHTGTRTHTHTDARAHTPQTPPPSPPRGPKHTGVRAPTHARRQHLHVHASLIRTPKDAGAEGYLPYVEAFYLGGLHTDSKRHKHPFVRNAVFCIAQDKRTCTLACDNHVILTAPNAIMKKHESSSRAAEDASKCNRQEGALTELSKCSRIRLDALTEVNCYIGMMCLSTSIFWRPQWMMASHQRH